MLRDEVQLRKLLLADGVFEDLAARLAAYGARLLEANQRVNLTGAKSPASLLPHLLDSLTIVPYMVDPVVDVGSGGGLPAIPLALATGLSVTLVESTKKKTRFLESALADLGLKGRVVAERAEIAARDPALRGTFLSGTARAVGSAPTVVELLLPFLAPGGLATVQRGTLAVAERNAAADAALVLGAKLEGEVQVSTERRILLIRKCGATPSRFPRAAGLPAKRPLCS